MESILATREVERAMACVLSARRTAGSDALMTDGSVQARASRAPGRNANSGSIPFYMAKNPAKFFSDFSLKKVDLFGNKVV